MCGRNVGCVYKQVIGSCIKCFPLWALVTAAFAECYGDKFKKQQQQKHTQKKRKLKHPLHFIWEMFFLWKGCFLGNYKPEWFTELKASTFGHTHFSLETQQQSTQHESQPDMWLPLPTLGGNSLLLETAERVRGQEGAGRRGLVPGCHSLGVTTMLQSLERGWTERMRNAPASLGEISPMMPGAVICLSRNVATCSN